MLEFLLGFSCGIYIATYYNCKPIIEKISKYFKENLPKKK